MRQLVRRYLDRRGARFVLFSAIGGFVFLMGLGLQAVLTGRWHVSPWCPT